MPATAAIFHHPDAMESQKMPLAGRRAAGQSFLAGYVRHAATDTLRCVAGSKAHIEHFAKAVGDFGWTGKVVGTMLQEPQRTAEHGAMMLPGPSLGPYSWVRRRVGPQAYSLIGITHTVSTRRICTSLYDLVSAPVEDWDAIICTSKAVHSVVAGIINESADYLSQRFGARRMPVPQLPIIPLGIDTERFAHDPEDRTRWREKLSIAEDEVLVMSMGRRSVFEKMHPAPLMLSLQQVAEQTGTKLVLLMAGWFGDETTEKLHRDAAKEMAPDVRVEFPDGKDPDLRFSLWSAADIFALPVDNIQETFGLVPVEAMAAGLPVVCSDWNGFKDTVIDGVTGYRTRTLMARPGRGMQIANRFEDQADSYHQYLGVVHQRTAVDVRDMTQALKTLVEDPDKRKTMGQAGQEHAKRCYDWSVIIPQYQALWDDLAGRRARGMTTVPPQEGRPADPSSIDPFTLYRRYPSMAISSEMQFTAVRRVTVADVQKMMNLSGATHLKRMVSRPEAVAGIQQMVHDSGPLGIPDLSRDTKMADGPVEAILMWLLKFDLIQLQT
ncbi:MAG: glycosyltransferase family 4 protein [Pseudomonadota bacterium]